MFFSQPEGSEVANTLRIPNHHKKLQCGFCAVQPNRKSCTHLDELVPASGDDDGVLGVGAEADA